MGTYKHVADRNELVLVNAASAEILKNAFLEEILFPGNVLPGGFSLDAFLGSGGMSQVWRAEAPDGSAVAIKLPRSEMAQDPGAQELIRREFRILDSLSSPHVLRAKELIMVGGSPALVTEYLSAGDLVSLCGTHPRHWAGAARDLAVALDHIHNQGMVHLDVKPRNVLLRNSQRASLVDFALAEPLGCRTLKGGGTPAYQSLDQRQGGAAVVGDDLHAFAVLLYELGTGHLPFGLNPSSASLGPLALFLDLPDSAPALSALAELVHATLGPDPKRRPKNMYVFLDVLESVVAFWQ